MKKILLFLGLIIGMIGFAEAQTVTVEYEITFTVVASQDIANHCVVVDPSSDPSEKELTAGNNSFQTKYFKTTCTDGSSYGYFDPSFSIKIKETDRDEYTFTSCNVTKGSVVTLISQTYPTNSITFTYELEAPSSSGTTYTFTPALQTYASLRTASATVYVNDASKVVLQCGGNYEPTLSDGSNTVYFNPENEYNWVIAHSTVGQPLNYVKLNNVDQTPTGKYYSLTVSNDDNVVIDASAPTTPCTVTFTGNVEAISTVYPFVNYTKGDPISGWDKGLDVIQGNMIIVSLNLADYKINSFSVNGTKQSVYNPDQYLTISSNTIINVDAERYSTNKVTFKVMHPESVEIRVAEGQWGATTELDIVPGTQIKALSSKLQYIIICNKTGGAVDDVSYRLSGEVSDTTAEPDSYNGYYYLTPSDGMTVTVNSHTIIRNTKASIKIEDINKLSDFYIKSKDGTYLMSQNYGGITPENGWNDFYFDPSDNPINFRVVSYETGYYTCLTKNGVVANPDLYQSSFSVTLDAHDELIAHVRKGRIFILNIDNPSAIQVYKSSSTSSLGTQITGLVAGPQAVTIESSYKYVHIKNATSATYQRVSDYCPTPASTNSTLGSYYVAMNNDNYNRTTINAVYSKERKDRMTMIIFNLSKVNNLTLKYKDGTTIFDTSGSNKPVLGPNQFYMDLATDNPLKLSFSTQNTTGDSYVTLNGETLSPAAATYAVNPTKTYNVIMTRAGDELYIHPDNTTTALDDLEIGILETDVIYDLMGRPIRIDSNIAPGIYIVNGRKVVIQ